MKLVLHPRGVDWFVRLPAPPFRHRTESNFRGEAVALIAVALLALAPPPVLHAQATASPSTLEQAVAAYHEAQETSVAADRPAAFARAERLFAAAAAQGGNAELWTNVGTAALQAEHVGAAIFAYRRALSLDPYHRRAQQNLTHARTLLPAWIPRPESGGFLDSFLAWRHAMSAGQRRGAAALAFALGAAMVGAALASGGGALRFVAVFPLAAWGLLLASGAAGGGDRDGVVTGLDTMARAADSRNAPARFAQPLPAGTEVTISDQRGDWTRVLLADGRDAWVSSAAVQPVAASAARE